MTNQEFHEFLHAQLKTVRELNALKTREYASGNDALATIHRIAAQSDVGAEGVCWLYLQKHLASISNHVKRADDPVTRGKMEPVEGRVHDAMLYLCLLLALFDERRTKEMAPNIVVAIDKGKGERND